MKSVRDTQKITNAMYLIASTKLRKARAELEATRPYFDALRTEIKRVFNTDQDIKNRYFDDDHVEDGDVGSDCGILVVTADKGLSGAYNINVIKETRRFLLKHRNADIFVVGEVGRHYFEEKKIPTEKNFRYTAQNPTIQRARDIAWELLSRYERGELHSIYIVYTDMKNSLFSQTRVERLLPFSRNDFETGDVETRKNFEFMPDTNSVLDTIVPNFFVGYIYSALVDSFCAEQNARMSAMSSANSNAQKLLDELAIQYNRMRQAVITQEITEVSAGAKAQKKKKKKNIDMQRNTVL